MDGRDHRVEEGTAAIVSSIVIGGSRERRKERSAIESSPLTTVENRPQAVNNKKKKKREREREKGDEIADLIKAA